MDNFPAIFGKTFLPMIEIRHPGRHVRRGKYRSINQIGASIVVGKMLHRHLDRSQNWQKPPTQDAVGPNFRRANAGAVATKKYDDFVTWRH